MTQTKVIQSTRQDIEGFEMSGKKYYDHVITVEGKDHHFVSTKSELNDFVAGKEATFTVEEKPMKNGQMRLKIVPVREQKSFGGGGFQKSGGFKAQDKDSAQISLLSCISSAATFNQGKGTWDYVLADALKAYELVRSKRGDFN